MVCEAYKILLLGTIPYSSLVPGHGQNQLDRININIGLDGGNNEKRSYGPASQLQQSPTPTDFSFDYENNGNNNGYAKKGYKEIGKRPWYNGKYKRYKHVKYGYGKYGAKGKEVNSSLEDVKKFLNDEEEEELEVKKIPGIDGRWTEWGACSKTCKGGLQRRKCTRPPPSNGGRQCEGESDQECKKDIICDPNTWARDNPCLNLQTIYKPKHWIPLLKNPCSKLSGPKCDATSRRHVAVVGAGMAGLIMSWVLKAVGHDVTLIEKTDRIGGRVETVYKKGWYGDMCAMRYKKKKDQPLTFATIEKFLGQSAMKPFTFTNEGKASYYFLDGKYFLSEKIFNEDNETLESVYKIFGLRNTENLYKCLTLNVSKEIKFNSKIMYRNPIEKIFLPIFTKRNEKEFLKRCRARLSVKQHIENEIRNSCHIDPDQLKALLSYVSVMSLMRGVYPISVIMLANYFPFDEDLLLLKQRSFLRQEQRIEKKGYYEIFNGSSSLPNAILNEIKEKFDKDFQVMFNKKVKNVIDKGNGVKLVFYDKSSILSDYIFMTPTAKAVSFINFDPPLPFNKKLALDDIHYVNSVKIFLNFDFPFWQYPGNGVVKNAIPYNSSGDNGGSFITDLPIRHGFYPSHSYHGTSILASYTWEDDADKLMFYSDKELVNIALDNLEILHGYDVRKHFKGGEENYAVKKCGIDKSDGCFVLPYPGQLSDIHFILKAPVYEGRVQFGGEYTQVEGLGWIQSAIQSALYSADQMFGNTFF